MRRDRAQIKISYAAFQAEYWTLTFNNRIAERNERFQDVATFAQYLECGKDNIIRKIEDHRLCAIRVGAHYKIVRAISLELLGANAVWYDPEEGKNPNSPNKSNLN